MKHLICIKHRFQKLQVAFIMLSFSFLMFSCATLDPQKVDVELPKTAPISKITTYTNPLSDLGLMTEIYDVDVLKIQSTPINDKTGASGPTGGEIPRDITEMLKSSLNSIGGRIIYIPYDPTFIQYQAATGYSQFEGKLIPDVILSGGITEFDRALEVRGGNTDVAGEKSISMIPDFFQGKNIGARYGGSGKTGLARITLDFNLLNFQTMSGIARMNTVNSMEVGKALKGKELSVSLFGITFGRKGTIRKVQGRHEAVRILVELSMIQIVGKYNALPYWRLLGDDVLEDKEVISALSKYYYNLNETEVISSVQEWLFLHGYGVSITGVLDDSTKNALQQCDNSYSPENNKIGLEIFQKVYITIPINEGTLARRNMLNDFYEQQQIALMENSAEPSHDYQETQVQESTDLVQESAEPVQEGTALDTHEKAVLDEQQISSAESEERKIIRKKKTSIGRFLTDDEW